MNKSLSACIFIINLVLVAFMDLIWLSFGSFILPLLGYCTKNGISDTDCLVKLFDRVAHSSHFFFPELQNHDLWYRRLMSSVCMLYKFHYSPNHSLGFLAALIHVPRRTCLAPEPHIFSLNYLASRLVLAAANQSWVTSLSLCYRYYHG